MCLLFHFSTRRDVHSAPVIGTMSSDSDKDVEEEDGIEEEDEMFPQLSSSGEETGKSSDTPQLNWFG